MSFGRTHDILETICPDGAVGFGMSAHSIEWLIRSALSRISQNSGLYQDLPLVASEKARFSFYIDDKTIKISSNWELSFDLRVAIHPPGRSRQEIVSIDFAVASVSLLAAYDNSTNQFRWAAPPGARIRNKGETWDTSGAGLATIGMTKEQFLDDIYYGFRWVTGAQLLPTLLSGIPFPQIHEMLGCFRLKPPFRFEQVEDYFVVWTDQVELVSNLCGELEQPDQPPSGRWNRLGSQPPASPYDDRTPEVVLFVGAQKIASWHAQEFAPAIHYRQRGGGFVRWSYEGWVAINSLEISLEPRPDGGALLLSSDLYLRAHAEAWMDGPCGTRIDAASASISGEGAANAEIALAYDLPTSSIVMAMAVQGRIDPSTIDIDTGGLIPAVVGEIFEALVRTGAVRVQSSLSHRSRTTLLDLSILGIGNSNPLRRIGTRSMLVGFSPQSDDG
jgi:hypothetical protein